MELSNQVTLLTYTRTTFTLKPVVKFPVFVLPSKEIEAVIVIFIIIISFTTSVWLLDQWNSCTSVFPNTRIGTAKIK